MSLIINPCFIYALLTLINSLKMIKIGRNVSELRIIVCKNIILIFLHFFVFLTVHLGIILDNDQLDTRLLYFTIRLL